jgi:hypothetical protein
MAGPTVCEKRWSEISTLFESNHNELLAGHPDYNGEIGLNRTALITNRTAHLQLATVNENGRSAERIGSQSRDRDDSALQAPR